MEKEFILQKGSGRNIELGEVQQKDTTQPNVNIVRLEPEHTIPLRRSGRVPQAPERYGFIIENNEAQIIQNDEPLTYTEAVMSRDSDKWLQAMESEIDSMYVNQVWNLVDAPEGVNPIGCKWIYKKKIGADGQVETYKARLVAKGFRQRQGVDYDETFSPVAMLKSIRIMLAIAAYHDYEIWQMDVKTAFLNGSLEEEVYMSQPEGFVSKDKPNQVCKLKKSIYGLKQASRSWNIRFDMTVKEFGFIKMWMNHVCIRKLVGVP